MHRNHLGLTLGGVVAAAVLLTTARVVTQQVEGPSILADRLVRGRPAQLADPRLAAARGETPPAPTEIAQWKTDRREHRRERLAWYESLHRTEPGVDWRAIEAANREALSLERFARLERGERTDCWDELGSVDLAGRTHAAYPSSDGTQLYVGSDLGGVWRGTIGGQDWTSLSDGLGRGSHQLLVVPPGSGPEEPEMVFTLTSATVHATSDGGQTWFVPAGLPEALWTVRRIVHDAAQPRTVYLLVYGRKYVGGTYQVGHLVMRSTNGGFDFEYRSNLGGSPPCDLWIDRVAGGALYALDGNTLYVSHDGALTFQALGTAPSGTAVSGALLTGSEAGGPTFYAALKEGSDWKLYRSIDGGVQWTYRYAISDFWETLVASITDPDLVFFAGVECFRSNDGGGSFTKLNNWWEYYDDPANKLHADLPGMDVHIVDGQETIYFNTDGGTYASTDGGLTVHNLSLWGLAISQYYSTFTSATDPYLIVGGSQDQGYQQSRPGGRGAYLPFEQLISGDYGHLTTGTGTHNWLYSVYPGFVLLQRYENSPFTLIQLTFPTCDHSWMPAITADPLDSDIFYFCGDHLWKYERWGTAYSYTRTELPQDFGAGGGYLTGLAISPDDYRYWFAVTSGGNLWYSHDAGANWTQSSHGPGSHYFYGTAIVASPTNRDVAYVGGSGYSGHAVWRTVDGGVTWQGFGTGLPQTLVLGLALGGLTNETPYAACEAGPYGYDETTGAWVSLIGTEAPLTTYWCVEWVEPIGAARFGTYGRGIWDYIPVDPAGVATGDATRGAHGGLRFALGPNPATGPLDLDFELRAAGRVQAELFDVSGRHVAQLAAGEFGVGAHRLRSDLTRMQLESGFYLVRLSAPEGVAVRRTQFIR